MHNFTPRLFIVVGSPASGKDEIISAVNTIGALHAQIVPKHTDREARQDDGDEMICSHIIDNMTNTVINPKYNMVSCDVQYTSFGARYGINTAEIWDKLQKGIMQVAVVSDSKALNQLKRKFGNLAVVIYVYSQIDRESYRKRETEKRKKDNLISYDENNEDKYIINRVNEFDKSWDIYVENFMLIDHVLIYADKQEDLFDQIFRLFKAYEKGWLGGA